MLRLMLLFVLLAGCDTGPSSVSGYQIEKCAEACKGQGTRMVKSTSVECVCEAHVVDGGAQ